MSMMPSKIRKPSKIEMIGKTILMSVIAIAIAPPTTVTNSAPRITRIINVMMKFPRR